MKKEKTAQKSLLERVKELGRKHGVKVTDMSEHGVRAIGIIGGIKKTNKSILAHFRYHPPRFIYKTLILCW